MKITIARECGCYGDEVGQVLADRLKISHCLRVVE